MKRPDIITFLVACAFCVLPLTVCRAQEAYNMTSFETECLGVEDDGSQTVRAWGVGKNKKDALAQARKTAVSDVIFKGIRAGVAGCNTRPLVAEVNARERYEDYFDRFFKDGGPYKKYVSNDDEKSNSRDKATSKMGVRYGVTIRVLRRELRERLKSDGIIK